MLRFGLLARWMTNLVTVLLQTEDDEGRSVLALLRARFTVLNDGG
jgi:hypothetical protein